jgi:signal transduction histidine kinase
VEDGFALHPGVDDVTGAPRYRLAVSRLQLSRSDVVLPSLVGLVGVIEIAAAGSDPVWVALGTYVFAAAVLAGRRRAPLAMPVLVGGIYATTPLLGYDVSEAGSWILLLALACFSAGRYASRSRWPMGLASVLVGLAITLAGLTWLTDFEPSLLFGTIVSVGSWAVGLALRGALDESRRAGAMAERARSERALAHERAVASERERIGRELHDVLAHSLGAMVVQASSAGDLVRREPVAAARALDGVAQAGRDAVAETGRLLRLLRYEHDELGRQATSGHGDPAAQQGNAARVVSVKDVLLPLAFGVIGTVEIVSHDYAPLWGSLGAYWLGVGVLCLRRAFPLAVPVGVTGIAVGAAALGANTEDPASWILVAALACFSAGRHLPRSRAAAGATSVLASLALLVVDAVPAWDVVMLLAWVVAPWIAGLALREALERTRLLAAEAEHARIEQEIEAERAAAAERKRIARELHDVLATSLSVMIVHATLAAELAGEDPDGAAAAVSQVERAGRAALGDTGRLLRLIRTGPDEVGTQPQPGVADIRALAQEYAGAGLGIDVEVADLARLPIGVELATYRIVQEALTNALKHSPGSSVRVHLARTRAEIAVEVRNGPPQSNGSPTVPSGHGLTGLRERVALFGGSLDARPTADGGFLLAATIPVLEPA